MAKGRPDFSISGKVVVDTVNEIIAMPDTTPKGSAGVAFRQEAGSGAGYVSPTGFEDADGDWTDEASAYDDNLGSAAQSAAGIPTPDWTGFLVFTLASSIRANKIRVQPDAAFGYTGIEGRKIDIDAYIDGNWVDIAEEENYTEDAYTEYSFAEATVEKYRIRFYLAEAVIIRIEETDIYQSATGGGEIHIFQDDASKLKATITNDSLATTPIVRIKTLTIADTEYEQDLQDNTKKVMCKCRDGTEFRLSWATGLGTTYLTIPPNGIYWEDNIDVTDKTLFLQCAEAGKVIEIIEWS